MGHSITGKASFPVGMIPNIRMMLHPDSDAEALLASQMKQAE